MNLQKRPVQKDDFVIEQEDGEIIVFHPASAKSFFLNESAAVIWEMCDGERRLVDIIEQLKESYPDQSSTVEQDVLDTIKLFLQQEVISLI